LVAYSVKGLRDQNNLPRKRLYRLSSSFFAQTLLNTDSYTAITRARRRVFLVGQKSALFIAIHRNKTGKRNTLLGQRIVRYQEEMSGTEAAGQTKMKRAG
jgi:hypothetical protein